MHAFIGKHNLLTLTQGIGNLKKPINHFFFLELTGEYIKVSEYKTNIQKSVAFLYANNKLSDQKEKLGKQ